MLRDYRLPIVQGQKTNRFLLSQIHWDFLGDAYFLPRMIPETNLRVTIFFTTFLTWSHTFSILLFFR